MSKLQAVVFPVFFAVAIAVVATEGVFVSMHAWP